MKKKIVLSLLLGCMLSAAVGCDLGKISETSSVKEQVDDKEKEDSEKEDKKEEDDSEEKKASDTPTFGEEDIEDYEGFEYLYGDMLISDSQENKKRTKLTVFLPADDYADVSGDSCYASSMGVTVRVELEPYLQYNAEDYLLEENLEYYLESYYDPFIRTDCKDIVISDIEELSKDACRATVEYCSYNKYDESYSTTFVTYYIAEIEKDTLALVSVEVNEDEVTGKTHRLLKELEEFYPFEIDWDKDRAEQKRETYIASGGDHMYSTGFVMFELPENWDEVTEDVSDYGGYVYAPEGDIYFSGCMITFEEDYLGYDEEFDIEKIISQPEEAKAILEEYLGESISELQVVDCETCLGKAAKTSFTVSMEETKAYAETYFIVSDNYLYIAQALQLEDATDDAFVVLDDILQNGESREW